MKSRTVLDATRAMVSKNADEIIAEAWTCGLLGLTDGERDAHLTRNFGLAALRHPGIERAWFAGRKSREKAGTYAPSFKISP